MSVDHYWITKWIGILQGFNHFQATMFASCKSANTLLVEYGFGVYNFWMEAWEAHIRGLRRKWCFSAQPWERWASASSRICRSGYSPKSDRWICKFPHFCYSQNGGMSRTASLRLHLWRVVGRRWWGCNSTNSDLALLPTLFRTPPPPPCSLGAAQVDKSRSAVNRKG